MIVFMHTEASWDHADPSSILNASLCWTISLAALSTFFFISGYLLFAGRQTFGPSDYFHSLRRRVASLLIPYLIWITIGYACTLAVDSPDSVSHFSDIAEIFWAKGFNMTEHSLLGYDSVPLGYPGGRDVLWFVRDLMIMTLLSPVIWWLAKLLRLWIFPLILAGILLHAGLPGLENRTVCYFSLGAEFAIYKTDPTAFIRRRPVVIITAWAILCAAGSAAVYRYDMNHILTGPKVMLLRDLTALSGVFALFAIASLSLRPRGSAEDHASTPVNRLMLKLAPAGFFIYVVHPLAIVEAFSRITDPLLPEKWQTFTAFIYFTVARLTLIPQHYFVLARVAHRTLAVITGGRTPRRPAPARVDAV